MSSVELGLSPSPALMRVLEICRGLVIWLPIIRVWPMLDLILNLVCSLFSYSFSIHRSSLVLDLDKGEVESHCVSHVFTVLLSRLLPSLESSHSLKNIHFLHSPQYLFRTPQCVRPLSSPLSVRSARQSARSTIPQSSARSRHPLVSYTPPLRMGILHRYTTITTRRPPQRWRR
jgi:hypothetical protein